MRRAGSWPLGARPRARPSVRWHGSGRMRLPRALQNLRSSHGDGKDRTVSAAPQFPDWAGTIDRKDGPWLRHSCASLAKDRTGMGLASQPTAWPASPPPRKGLLGGLGDPAIVGSPVGTNLVFKGGTSLSRPTRSFEPFSEDVDLTFDTGRLIPLGFVEGRRSHRHIHESGAGRSAPDRLCLMGGRDHPADPAAGN